MSRSTIYEVSKLAGVSLATVSRVINNSGRVTEKTRRKVEAAMRELGYRPNSIAQSLASNRSNSVGILVPELHGPFFGNMLSGIEAELRGAEKHVIITVGHSDEAKEIDGIEFLITRRCDALILHVDAVPDDYLVKLDEAVPVVLINRTLPALAGRCVNLDNELGGRLATRALLDRGHRSLACISGPLWKRDARERLEGFRNALHERGVEPNPELIVEGDFQESGGREGMKRLLATGIPFTGLVCGNDSMAAGAVDAARASGLSIPEDLSVVGFDNILFASWVHPQLTTIDYPVVDMGRMAARIVLQHVYDASLEDVRNLFEPKLIERASVVPAPAPARASKPSAGRPRTGRRRDAG
jgi:LacI family transcriptional regulator